MTPTEQDEELRRAIVNYRIKCDYYLSDRDEGVISQEDYEKAISSELDLVIKLFAADRERVALEARIDERNKIALDNYRGKTVSESTNWQAKFEYFMDSNERRTAELKEQYESIK